MHIHLKNEYNNKKINKNTESLLSDIIRSIEFRIIKHQEYIENDKHLINEYIYHTNIITDAINRINKREAKIEELQKFMELL